MKLECAHENCARPAVIVFQGYSVCREHYDSLMELAKNEAKAEEAMRLAVAEQAKKGKSNAVIQTP